MSTLSLALVAAIPLVLSPATYSRLRVSITYVWRHRRLPHIAAPVRFTEWVQWRKLFDRDFSLALLTDKLRTKEVARAFIGDNHVIPTLWSGTDLPPLPPWPFPFIVKANHGCGQFVVVRNSADWQRAQREAPKWLASPYGIWLDEWHYSRARRCLVVEPFVGPSEGLPVDYKIYVFDGVARCIQVHLDRASDHRWMQYDRDWHPLSVRNDEDVRRPATLDNMLRAAEAISMGRDFLRVDFYEVDGGMLFGETCLFPGSGLDPFQPDALDFVLGGYWSDARAYRAKTAPVMSCDHRQEQNGGCDYKQQ
ncbi:MAG: hypothetical protein C0429_06320 [Sphingopyxis sp.]|nr:hypothetical protein [Sphingopyxis sp.]